MAERQISWTDRAIRERTAIFDYWYHRNKSATYPKKLHRLFNASVKLIASRPGIGKIFNSDLEIRFVMVRDYRIYYAFDDSEITVLSVWDTRRNPDKFKL